MNLGFRFLCAAALLLAGAGRLCGVNINSFSPTFGAASDTQYIYIYGSGFSNTGLAVYFNGVRDTSAYSPSSTLIQSRVPAGAPLGSNPIVVYAGGSSAKSVQDFTVIGLGPYITGFTPVTGSDGTQVTITGAHFAETTSVTFAGKPGTGISVPGYNQITVNAPVGVTSGPITVTTPLGSWTTSSNFYVPPVITGFTPGAARIGDSVTITGVNFLGTSDVWFTSTSGTLSVPATAINVLSNGAVQVTVPDGAVSGKIRLNAPAGSDISSGTFKIAPAIYSFSPTFGPPGTLVTISGASFVVGGTTVSFNGTASPSVSVANSSQLTATVPSGANSGPLTVSTSAGSDTSTTVFLLPPTISSLTPNNSAPGTWITISGRNFLGTTAVEFNGQPATAFNVTNNTTLGAKVPPGVVSGFITVANPAGMATSSSLFYGAPAITGFWPASGVPGTSVTISGGNFLDASAVRFYNNVSAAYTVSDNGQIIASVPDGAQTGPITVVAPAGSSTSASPFTMLYPADLAVWDSHSPSLVTIGSNLVYTIVVNNYGPYAATNTRLTNTLPASVDYVSGSATAGGSLSRNGNVVTATWSSLNNQANATCWLTVVPRAIGVITNRMSVGSDAPDLSPDNNTATFNTLVQSLPLLSIRRATNDLVQVFWPADLTNYALQTKEMLSTNYYWSNVTTKVSITNLTNFVITEEITNTTKFYRLKR